MVKQLIIPESVLDLVDYDPETGYIGWKERKKNTLLRDKKTSFSIKKYASLVIGGKRYSAHRLAWFVFYKTQPDGVIDHINGDMGDNRISNLRLVSQRENCANRVEHRNGKLPGTSFHKKTKKWRSCISINKKLVYLGWFNTEIDAYVAYLEKLREL